MNPHHYWTHVATRPPFQLLCVACGAIRPTLELPSFKCDPITRTFGGIVAFSFLQHQTGSGAPAPVDAPLPAGDTK